MKEKIYIGIDPGKNTGIGVWSSTKKKILGLHCLDFWDAHFFIINAINTYLYYEDKELMIVIEDPNLNKPVFPSKIRYIHELRQWMKVAQNIGSNKRDAQLWIDYCKYMKAPFATVRPSKKTYTKLTSDQFNKMTGWKGRSNEHSRDAIMLVFGR